MRLICTIKPAESKENPNEFSYFLTSKGIKNQVERLTAAFDSPAHIWVYDEDMVDNAVELYRQYQQDPHDSQYRGHYEAAIKEEEQKWHEETENDEEKTTSNERKKSRILSPAPYGRITVVFLIMAIMLFIWAQVKRGVTIPPKIPGIVQAPMLSSMEQALIYDYPEYFTLRDQLFSIYTPENIKQKMAPSLEAMELIKTLRKTPVWMGIYERVVDRLKNRDAAKIYDGKLFTKIREGEIWRLFTPALLHLDLLHIFFNALWFILLGNQIEYRIGSFRYIILIILTAIISNTAQYLMSGPFFMGLSGIVVGMAGFIFARQQVAPWEGYLLHRFTLIFLAIFVVGMFFLQLSFFFLQIFGKLEFTIGIANTAHLVGGSVGYLLGRMPYFSIRHKHS